MFVGLRSARPKAAPLRSLLLGVLVLALSTIGLVTASPARAAASTITGTGSGDYSVTLAKGFYETKLSYAGNSASDEPTVFMAMVDSEDETVVDFLALDVKESNSTHKVVQVPSAMTVSLYVEAADDAAWTVSFEKISGPSTAVSTVNFASTGLNSSPLYRLKSGAYQVTTTFAGNVHPVGLEDLQEFGMAIALYAESGNDQDLAVSDKTQGTITKTVRISKTGLYWINPLLIASDATWSVKMVALKSLTSTPTPKISGTAKVGKTLKAKAGTWKPSGVKLSYQWYRGSSKISGATKSSYKLTSKDKGKKIKVTVTGSKSGYLSVGKTSKSTGTVKK